VIFFVQIAYLAKCSIITMIMALRVFQHTELNRNDVMDACT